MLFTAKTRIRFPRPLLIIESGGDPPPDSFAAVEKIAVGIPMDRDIEWRGGTPEQDGSTQELETTVPL